MVGEVYGREGYKWGFNLCQDIKMSMGDDRVLLHNNATRHYNGVAFARVDVFFLGYFADYFL